MTPKQLSIGLFFTAWLAVVVLGLIVLWNYANKPGLPAKAKPTWPAITHLQRDSRFPTLVMFAHPHCACSEASVGELNQIMAKVNGKLGVIIIFVTPKNPEPSWKHTSLWSAAKLLSGAQVILDEDGIEADRFGARTSGQVLLYDGHGKLVFSGGITSARGHSGDNFGKSAIISFLNEHQLARNRPSPDVYA